MEIRFERIEVERGGRPGLRVPSLVIGADRVTALVGPSGAGKTTLLRLIAGLERPAAGELRIGGVPVPTGRRARPPVASAFQPPEFGRGSVRATLEARLRGRERARRAAEAAEACGIGHLLDREVRTLAGGEKQRANVAAALCVRAPVTLLDEPLAGLGDAGAGLTALLRGFGATVVVAVAAAEDASALADDIVVMEAGAVLAAGPLAQVLAAPPDARTAALLGYALVTTDAGMVGVWPGALSAGTGPATFTMVVDRALPVAGGVEVRGRIGDGVASVRLGPGLPAPRPGSRLAVSAPPGSLIRFAKQAAEGEKNKGPALEHEVPESR